MKTIDEKIAVMRAWLEGERIEVRREGQSWHTVMSKPTWNWDEQDYREAPGPQQQDQALADVYKRLHLLEARMDTAIQILDRRSVVFAASCAVRCPPR
jgi:hypothetical protein